MYDVIVIGGGVVGCAVARYLMSYKLKLCVIERGDDVCTGTSKANSAIIHAGFDAKPGSVMAKMNVMGSRMMPSLARELDVPYKQIGSLVLCFDRDDMPKLNELYENGVKNGVEGLELIDAERLHELEPNVSSEAVAALYAPTGAIVCPFELTMAFAENAVVNGAEFKLNTNVLSVKRNGDAWRVITDAGCFDTRCVVNAAGVYAAEFHNMVSTKKLRITARRGDYVLLDRSCDGFVKHTIFQLPHKFGKGVLVSPTVHGNIIVGPTAVDVDDKEATNTTREGLDNVLEKSKLSVPTLPTKQTITSFAGLRAHEDGHEFVIGEVSDAAAFFDCAGIESPGLSSACAIGHTLSKQIADKLNLECNEDFVAVRSGPVRPNEMSFSQRNELVAANPAYGRIVCRCENVSEGEIIDAIRRPLGARSLDAVKRRTRAGMGRCQSGFCSPRVMEVLSRELSIPLSEVTKCGGDSRFIMGRPKDAYMRGTDEGL